MLESHYTDIRLLHIGCVVLSGCLFTLRGALRIGNAAVANHVVLRVTSYVIDTLLLSAAISLTLILHQYPFVNGWLTAKVLLLVLYIALGVATLKSARTRTGRIIALMAALATFGFIIGIAITHRPAGWLSLIR